MRLSMPAPLPAQTGGHRIPAVLRGWSAGKVFAALCLVNVILALLLLGRQPPGANQDEAATAPPPLPAQVEQLLARIAEGRHDEPYVLSLTDQELTDAAGHFIAASPDVPFQQVKVRIASGRLVADGVTKGLAVTVPVRLQATLSARDGTLVAQVVEVSLGSTPLPGFARDQVLREANKALDFSRYDMPITVDTVELRQGSLAISGSVK